MTDFQTVLLDRLDAFGQIFQVVAIFAAIIGAVIVVRSLW